MTCGIYSITNTVNGKRYYGSSVNMEGRQRQHWSDLRNGKHKNPHLQAAWNKYGESSFVFAVVERLSLEQLAVAEQRYLDQNQGGYNIGQFADAPARGRKKTPEAIAKMSAAKRGRPLSDAHRKALSIAGRGRKNSPETRAKLSAVNSGKRHSNETKGKLSTAVRVRWSDASYREKTVAAQLASHCRQDVKANTSAAMIARWSNPDQRKKLSDERKARWADPEYRTKMLEKRRLQGQQLRERNALKNKEKHSACA